MTWPVFSEASRCPKCGAGEARVEFCRCQMIDGVRAFAQAPPSGPGHLHRTCVRCGYVWEERPLDSLACAAVRVERREMGCPLPDGHPGAHRFEVPL